MMMKKKDFSFSRYLFMFEVAFFAYLVLCVIDINARNLSQGLISAWNFFRYLQC